MLQSGKSAETQKRGVIIFGIAIGACIGLILSSAAPVVEVPVAFDSKQFRELVVRPALKEIGLWSQAAEDLLLGTAAQESRFGTYLKQLGNGPALGVYQMEPATFDWLKGKYEVLADRQAEEMIWDLKLATRAARFRYLAVIEPLPRAGSVEALAKYWKQHYNTVLGGGTVQEFITNWDRFVKGRL